MHYPSDLGFFFFGQYLEDEPDLEKHIPLSLSQRNIGRRLKVCFLWLWRGVWQRGGNEDNEEDSLNLWGQLTKVKSKAEVFFIQRFRKIRVLHLFIA